MNTKALDIRNHLVYRLFLPAPLDQHSVRRDYASATVFHHKYRQLLILIFGAPQEGIVQANFWNAGLRWLHLLVCRVVFATCNTEGAPRPEWQVRRLVLHTLAMCGLRDLLGPSWELSLLCLWTLYLLFLSQLLFCLASGALS